MDYLEYDVAVTDEQNELRRAAHAFAERVVRPAGIALDRLPPEQVIAPDSPLFTALRQAAALGYTRLGGTPDIGGMGLSPLSRYLVLEELAWGSVGVGAVIFFSTVPADVALALRRLGLGDGDLVEELALPAYACTDGSIRGCWAITEPDHGSDTLAIVRPGLSAQRRGRPLGVF